ncbi:MAG: ABC transporter ATP-binding protein, partial [Candidatus Puniceispirillaceae bacterium]
NLALGGGETVALHGKNGAGKSTLLALLTGNLDASRGEVRIQGQRLTPDTPLIKRQIGYLPQNPTLPRWASGREILTYAAGLYGLPQARDRVEAAQVYWDCASYQHKPLATLSYGMQKRVALARAIVDEPEILLFDEPTSGLDPITGGVIDRLIIDARKRLGATTVTISHDMASVRRIADKVAMVHNGVIIWAGSADNMENSGVPEVHQFVHGLSEGPLTREMSPSQKAHS